MSKEELIRNLKYTMKKHKNDIVHTFDTNISLMCKDILDYLEQEPCEVEAAKLQQAYNKGFEDCKQEVLDIISELNAISFYEAQEDSKECYYEIRNAIKQLSHVKTQELCDECRNKRTSFCGNCKDYDEFEQKPCDDTVSIRKDVLKCRVGNIVAYNVEWLKKHWQMEMDIVCGVKPCDDAIIRDMALEKMADYVASGYADSAEDFEEYSRIICQLPSVTHKSGKWINVNDMLPREREDVLVTCFVHENWQTKIGYWNGKAWVVNAYDILFIDRLEVTAWMPLPKPYEPQESEEQG